jgi:hypothetical protein
LLALVALEQSVPDLGHHVHENLIDIDRLASLLILWLFFLLFSFPLRLSD